jgi:alanine-synthesizing transaminase
MPMTPDRVVITSGTSEGIELALTALAGPGDEVLIPVPTYPLYTAVLAKIGAKAVFYRTDEKRGWQPDVEHVSGLITPSTRALVVIDANNPPGATYSIEARRALVDLADRHNFPLLADEVYADLAFDGPVPAIAALNEEAPVITFSSLSKAYLAPGWRSGWLAVGKTDRLDEVLGGIKKLADGRLCSTGPMEHALAEALTGDRSHQHAFHWRCENAPT